MDIRRRRVVLLFCLFVGVDVCLGKVPPCVCSESIYLLLTIGPDSTQPHPVEREAEKEKEGEMRRNLGVRNVGVIDCISCWYC